MNKVSALLEAAKEKPSARFYAFTLLDKLQPSYAAAVLALKAGEALTDASKIDWDKVTAFVNSHERILTNSKEKAQRRKRIRDGSDEWWQWPWESERSNKSKQGYGSSSGSGT